MNNNFINNLPKAKTFTNLHFTENFKVAKDVVNGLSGVYAIICTTTGAVYIGNAIDLSVRMVAHLFYNSTNSHLKMLLVCMV